MSLKSLIFCSSLVISGCLEDSLVHSSEFSEEIKEDEETFEEAEHENSKQKTSNSEVEENSFDACPEDTYFLWEENGIRYEVTIEVFCEPVMDLNLGCPAPY